MGIGLSRGRRRRLEADDQSSVLAAPPSAGGRHSPGLEAALSTLPEDRQWHVLELGSVQSANLEFLATRGARVWIADLPRALRDGPREGELHVVLPAQDEVDPFDLVLAWDIFNYLDRDQLSALCARLVTRTRPGGALFAQVVTEPTMSAQPRRFEIRDSRTLASTPVGQETRAAPQWAPALVERCLAGFRVERSFILRHGVQEYLARRPK